MVAKAEAMASTGEDKEAPPDGNGGATTAMLEAEASDLSKLEAEVSKYMKSIDAARGEAGGLTNELMCRMTKELSPLLGKIQSLKSKAAAC